MTIDELVEGIREHAGKIAIAAPDMLGQTVAKVSTHTFPDGDKMILIDTKPIVCSIGSREPRAPATSCTCGREGYPAPDMHAKSCPISHQADEPITVQEKP